MREELYGVTRGGFRSGKNTIPELNRVMMYRGFEYWTRVVSGDAVTMTVSAKAGRTHRARLSVVWTDRVPLAERRTV